MGRYKWHQLGIPFTLENVGPPENELVERACVRISLGGSSGTLIGRWTLGQRRVPLH